jgi:HAD superfamily, subfamily IIIB (Acid phosphatase)
VKMMTPKINAVGWDLDSTVFNIQHRKHMLPLIKEKKATYSDYSLMCVNDTVLPGRVEMMTAFTEAGLVNIGISGRNDIALEQTWEVIFKFNVPLGKVILRSEGDHTPNGVYKVRRLRELETLGYNIRFFLEDWREAGEYITRETGIPVIILDPCYSNDPDPAENNPDYPAGDDEPDPS